MVPFYKNHMKLLKLNSFLFVCSGAGTGELPGYSCWSLKECMSAKSTGTFSVRRAQKPVCMNLNHPVEGDCFQQWLTESIGRAQSLTPEI